jgi:hypothetical protein
LAFAIADGHLVADLPPSSGAVADLMIQQLKG